MNAKKSLLNLILLAIVYVSATSFSVPDLATTYYYIGEIKTSSADGINYGTYMALTKQVMNNKDKSSTTEVISVDQLGQTKDYGFSTIVKGMGFQIIDKDNNYKGKGEFTGFKRWKYTIDYTNPVGQMIGDDKISATGLEVNKDFYGPDGKLSVTYHEKHSYISKELYEIIYLQILKGKQ